MVTSSTPSLRRRLYLSATVPCAITVLLFAACTPRWLVHKVADSYPGCLYEVSASEKLIALTIDDGPDSSTTPRILDVLARHNARATFFLISSRVSGNDKLVVRLLNEGHEIGNHFTHDEASINLPRSQFRRSFQEADSVLKRFARVHWVRPGWGLYDSRMLRVFRAKNYRCALGSVHPFDPQLPFPGHITRVLTRGAYPGAIIVLHDHGYMGRNTVKALRRVLPDLHRRGYRVVTLSELVEADTASAGTH